MSASTSLAEQLRRLAAPQTSILVDSKKRPSILFDPSEAANKDRNEIYEIGHAGLIQLIALNPLFMQFEDTLFNQTAKKLERSIESSEINKHLDKTIKKFCIHLSPYFPLKPAHCCLEWLIRRFNIHHFNKNEFMGLILPYHETMIFVKCLQTFDLRNPNDSWHWLQPLQKPGVRLSKTEVLSRAASDAFFLQFVCGNTMKAVKELDSKAPNLRVHINFYCTTVIGALEYAHHVKEDHIFNILPSVLKALPSHVSDFCAAALMITAQLIHKAHISSKLLNELIKRICAVDQPMLQSDVYMLLVLIFQRQKDRLPNFPENSLIKVVGNKNAAQILHNLSEQNIEIGNLCVALISQCLRHIQVEKNDSVAYKKFLNDVLVEVHFKENNAGSIIRAVLDNYRIKPIKREDPNEVIQIDSDDEGMFFEEDFELWYSEFLQSLEHQYPEQFDATIKETLQEKTISETRKRALKTVLAFRLKSSYNDNSISIYENLYHYNMYNRLEAVKYIVKNTKQFSSSPHNHELLKESVGDRLCDDSPLIVYEVLKLETTELIKIIGSEAIVEKLTEILSKGQSRKNGNWEKTMASALQHLTKRSVYEGKNKSKIFLAILPFLYAKHEADLVVLRKILNSDLREDCDLLRELLKIVTLKHFEISDLVKQVDILLNSCNDLPTIDEILDGLKGFGEAYFENNAHRYAYFLILVRSAYGKDCDTQLGLKLFEIVNKLRESFEFYPSQVADSWLTALKTENKISLKLFLDFIGKVMQNTKCDFKKFDANSDSMKLILKILEILITNAFTTKASIKKEYTEALKTFIDSTFDTDFDKFEFFANFFISDKIPNLEISPEYQIRGIRLFCILAINCGKDFKISTVAFVKMLIALNSEISVVRTCVLQCFELVAISSRIDKNIKQIASKCLEHKEEITLDHEQIFLIAYNVLSLKGNEGTPSVLDDIFQILVDKKTSTYLQSGILKILMFFKSSSILKKILPVGLEMLSYIETNLNSTEDFVLDEARGEIFQLIVHKFDEKAIKALKKTFDAWKLIENALNLYDIILTREGESVSIACVIVDIFTERMYDVLPSNLKASFIRHLVNASTFSSEPSVMISVKKLMKRINLSGRHIEQILREMHGSCSPKDAEVASAKKRTAQKNALPICLNSPEWRSGVTLLEFLQNKKKLENCNDIVPLLFDILKACLSYEEQASLEYAKQLILSSLLICCQKFTTESQKDQTLLTKNLEKTFHVELVVQCIRATQNPQTHHHALLLLAQCANILPQKVLHNMMDIFTFMGSSVLRHDDAFSFQIISNIIESVVPILITANPQQNSQENSVIPVLKVFSDIILDVPEHRREALYIKLLQTLGAKKYLWMFLGVLFESHVIHDATDKVKHTPKRHPSLQEEFPQRIGFALQITKNFDPETIIQTCINLFDYLMKLPLEKTELKDAIGLYFELFNIKIHSDKQLRHYKYIIVQFISNLTSSAQFINQIALLGDEDTTKLKPFYQSFIIKILMYVPDVTSAVDQYKETNQQKYWKVMLHHCYDILDNAISLLTPDMLLRVIHGLMEHKILAVRKKVIELFISKLQQKTDYFAECSDEHLLNLLGPLFQIVDSISDKAASTNENLILQQITLNAIKLLSKILAGKHPAAFKELVLKLVGHLKKRESIPKIIVATIALSLTETCSNLKVQAISLLPKFMPHLIAVLKDQVTLLDSQPPDQLNIAVVTSVQKIVEALPLFLSPYLTKIIAAICEICAKIEKWDSRDQRATILKGKLASIQNRIATNVPLRVLLPAIDETYTKQIENQQVLEIPHLMKLLVECFSNILGHDIAQLQSELTAFFLQALEFRSTFVDFHDQAVVTRTEEHILQAFVSLILKLSESSFRPLYHKVYDWAIRNSTVKERSITYFLLSNKVAEALKSLFVLFAGDFVQNAADLLDKCNTSKCTELFFIKSESENALLVEHILRTLNHVFLHDSKGFVNAHRFDILIQPIVDQIENNIVVESESLTIVLSACIAQFAIAVSNDTLWKQLNYQVLLKTRNNNPEMRIIAFNCCVEIARKLGEDFNPLLPETIPFVAELMEDDNEKVEKNTRNGVREMEKVLGESLQKYF